MPQVVAVHGAEAAGGSLLLRERSSSFVAAEIQCLNDCLIHVGSRKGGDKSPHSTKPLNVAPVLCLATTQGTVCHYCYSSVLSTARTAAGEDMVQSEGGVDRLLKHSPDSF